ncbi:MAG: tRNA (N(6)-L-threonylcarbamoyladenosine(37)-C(2))-methylthiotransferase MtaB [Syntrophales bacterium]|nr:tRNA (N(6)-L-threonylcarbamoyladenosine(37)-C(2))-methylthiotransferase MtaB [Syntrophales bacterium]
MFHSDPDNSPRVALATLGCKVNQYESATLAESLERRGFSVRPFAEEADCYIINTCTVTGRTDYQSRQMIRRAVRRNPRAFVVVTGCYAQINAEEITAIPGVTVVAGNREKDDIPRLIADLWAKRNQCRDEDHVLKPQKGMDDGHVPFNIPDLGRFPGHTRAFLKIQDGCNTFCSYCIVPYARGRSRSLPPAEVIQRITRLAGSGYREVVLTGIHLGCYGQDIDPPTHLTAILRKVEEMRLIERLRLSSIEPREVTNDFLEVFKEATVICPHLHIPLQSGDDEVLSLMKRNYDSAYFRALIETIVAIRPDSGLGMDVMVGFPGEDERAFDNTYHLIEEMPVAYLHVFPFSKRPGTSAAAMKGQVKEEVKKGRAESLRRLGQEKRRIFMNKFIGKRLHVLLESRPDRKTGLMKGFSQHYLPVIVKNGNPSAVNTIVTVMAEGVCDEMIIGEIITE